MIDSLRQRNVLGFQGVIAAGRTLCVKEFSQPQQCQKVHTGSAMILQSSTERLVNHPAWKDTVRSIGQRDNDVFGIKL
jgi:hypothetical protein